MLSHDHGEDHVYHLGACLLDMEDLSRVLRRPQTSILWPEELWEIQGQVPNVVFSCANPVVDGKVYVYYGGADHVVGLATAALDDLIEYVRYGEA